MVKDLVSALDYSNCATAALLLFVVSFVGIVYGSMRLSRKSADAFASIPLSDNVETPRDE
ncbi:MAG TPA: hypothetical protein DDW52_10460 [Planctomycetaceae bacterium]|nr:hypothetical protein [Planctomycetaceae bacterium]